MFLIKLLELKTTLVQIVKHPWLCL